MYAVSDVREILEIFYCMFYYKKTLLIYFKNSALAETFENFWKHDFRVLLNKTRQFHFKKLIEVDLRVYYNT